MRSVRSGISSIRVFSFALYAFYPHTATIIFQQNTVSKPIGFLRVADPQTGELSRLCSCCPSLSE